MVVDTGATHTIVRSDLLPKWRLSLPSQDYLITTASGETMGVSGEMVVNIEVGSRTIPHRVFVADIADPVILGIDFMVSHKSNFRCWSKKYEDWKRGGNFEKQHRRWYRSD